jgi:hypothetical protein
MLGHIYYTLGLIPLLMTLAIIIKLRDYNRVKEWYSKFEKVTGGKPKQEDFRSTDEYSIYTGVSGIMILDFIWIILGLLTQSWYIFLFILSFTIVLNIIKKAISLDIISRLTTAIIIITKFSVYLYLIINHFHLHYNTWEVVKSLIQ